MSLVTTDWALNNLNSLKIIDASWHMPAQKRNPAEEYRNGHIPNSIFFDLEENSEKDTDLPHMLPKPKAWEKIMCSLGINNNDEILIKKIYIKIINIKTKTIMIATVLHNQDNF